MEVYRDINYTGDITIDGSTEHFDLDLYVPGDSDILAYETYQNVTTNTDIHESETGTNVSRRKLIEGDKFVNQTTRQCDVRSEHRNHHHNNPFVVFIHGGGWRRGDRDAWRHYLYYDVNFLVSLSTWMFRTYGNVGESFALNGVPCAVISYPLTELGTHWLLFEMMASYILSCLVTFVTLFVTIATVLLYSIANDAHSYSHWSHLHGRIGISHWKEKLLLTMLVTNLIMACLFTVKTDRFRLTKSYVVFLWIYIIVCSIPLKSCPTLWLTQIVLGTFLAIQFTIMRLRLKRAGRSVKDQVKVVAKAIRWVERSCGRSNPDIFVMGHSAGGHLACLTMIEGSALMKEGCSLNRIKGVISVSGVYDVVRSLNRPMVKGLYLYPTFGQRESQWLEASPHHLIENWKQHNRQLPPFLLISAEKDLFLKQQSRQFYKTLQEAEVDCSHVEIKRTNHFTVIVNFKQSNLESEFSAISDVINFIQK